MKKQFDALIATMEKDIPNLHKVAIQQYFDKAAFWIGRFHLFYKNEEEDVTSLRGRLKKSESLKNKYYKQLQGLSTPPLRGEE